jgi:GGDEF domain-containing protein
MNSYPPIRLIKLIYCLIAGIGLGGIAILDYPTSHLALSAGTMLYSMVLLTNAVFLLFKYKIKTEGYLSQLLIISIFAYSLLSARYGGPQHAFWIYFFPVVAFFLFKLNTGILLTTLYIPAALYIIIETSQPLHQAQMVFSFAVVTMVSLFLSFVKTRTNSLLDPLISRDLNTGAQLAKFLRPALAIEITRAEREGTGLLLMQLRIQLEGKRSHKHEMEETVTKYAKSISENLRLFDRYYRIDKQSFSIILPHATTQEGTRIAQNIIQGVTLSSANKTTFGLASLNVGDTADSLIHISEDELNNVSNKYG